MVFTKQYASPLGGILLGLACTVGLALVFWCYRRILKRYSKRS